MKNPRMPEDLNPMLIGLGALNGYFPVKKMRRAGNLVFCLLCLGAAALVLLYGLYTAYVATLQHGPAMIDEQLSTPSLIALGLFLIGLLAGVAAIANWKKGLAVYQNGFAVRGSKGIRIWRWEEIVSLTAAVTRHYTNGIYTGTTHIYTLLNRLNERLVLNDAYIKIDEAEKVIEQSIFPLLYSRAADQYNTGQTLIFGPVAVSKGGILISKKTYPWEEVKEVSIHQGILKVSKKEGGWFSGASASAATIPNRQVLFAIINQIVGLKAG
jgi:hypothetical protein